MSKGRVRPSFTCRDSQTAILLTNDESITNPLLPSFLSAFVLARECDNGFEISAESSKIMKCKQEHCELKTNVRQGSKYHFRQNV